MSKSEDLGAGMCRRERRAVRRHQRMDRAPRSGRGATASRRPPRRSRSRSTAPSVTASGTRSASAAAPPPPGGIEPVHRGVGVPDRHARPRRKARPSSTCPCRPSRSARAGTAAHGASTAARSAASTSGRRPNQASKPGAAWCSSMPRPSTATRPQPPRLGHERRSARRHRRHRRRPRSAGAPPRRHRQLRPAAMPSDVVLTIVAASPPPPRRRPSRRHDDRAPKCAAQRLGARRGVRLAMRTSGAPSREQRVDDRRAPRRRRRAPAPGRPPPRQPRRLLPQVGDEAVAVGIVGVDRAVRRRR